MTPRFQIDFDPEQHRYKVNGNHLPSVTTVLEAVLESMKGIPRDFVQQAGQFGDAVHLMCELYDQGELDEATLDPHLVPYLNGYKRFLADKQPRWTLIEAPVASLKYGYAGTLDRAGTIGKTDWLVDLKSSRAIPKTVGPQTAAYHEAAKETFGWSAKKRAVLLLQENTYQWQPLNDISDWSLFVSCLNVYRYKEKHCART